jgi:hypothetical protein
MALQNSIFTPRWIKSTAAYTSATIFTYLYIKKMLKEEYLVDLALEYSPNFGINLSCP